MNIDLVKFKQQAEKKSADNKKLLLSFKKKDTRKVDDIFHTLHDAVFANTDCLQCANCCKTTSPIFYQNDVERLSKLLRIKPGAFIEKYLRVDEDNDMVLKSSPCPFLDSENYCSVYEDRPKACREYPHTNRKKIIQIMSLTHKNTLVCPAVYEMVERLRSVNL